MGKAEPKTNKGKVLDMENANGVITKTKSFFETMVGHLSWPLEQGY